MTKHLNLVQSAIAEYHDRFRHPSLERLELSGLCLLFPEEAPCSVAELHWNDTWPNNDRSGAYFIFNSNLQLIYIGKSILIGGRLRKYFGYHKDRTCKIKSKDWSSRAAFVGTSSVSEEFEASSFEEFLIARLRGQVKTLENKIGTRN